MLQSDLLGSTHLKILFQYVVETDLHLQYILYAYNHHHLLKHKKLVFTKLMSTIIT